MLRQFFNASVALRPATPFVKRWSSSAPTVFDKIVQLTVVDKEGHRHVVRGLEGQTVADVIEGNLDTFGDDVMVTSPVSPDQFDSHVKIPSELFSAFPTPTGYDQRSLEEVADTGDLDVHSRLASQVVLSRQLGDILVSLGRVAPWKTL